MGNNEFISEKRRSVPTPKSMVDEHGKCEFGTFKSEFENMELISSALAYNKHNRFQFPPLREGRLSTGLSGNVITKDFNSRPCVRGDSVLLLVLRLHSYFNSRPCVRGDQKRYYQMGS